MATRAEIVQALAKRRFNRYYWPNFTRTQVKQAANAMTDAEWDAIVSGIRSTNPQVVGETLIQQVQDHLMAKAVTDIEDRLGVDDTLTIAELQDLF